MTTSDLTTAAPIGSGRRKSKALPPIIKTNNKK